MKFTTRVLIATLGMFFGAANAAPVARVILNGDPGEFVVKGDFYDMTIDPTVDRLYLSTYPSTNVPPMVGFMFTFDHTATNRWGSIALYGMTAGSTSEYGSLSFWGSGCNSTQFSSQTHESVVSGFNMTRFVASFSQSCVDSPNDTDTQARGIFIYDTAGNLAIPEYLTSSPVLTPTIPEPSSLALGFIGLAGVGFIMSQRRCA